MLVCVLLEVSAHMHKWQNKSADVDSRAQGHDIYKKTTSSVLLARVYVCENQSAPQRKAEKLP